jgi:hypothetical protein
VQRREAARLEAEAALLERKHVLLLMVLSSSVKHPVALFPLAEDCERLKRE